MDAKLTGLRIQPQPSKPLTPPDQLAQKAQPIPQQQIQFENLPTTNPVQNNTQNTETVDPVTANPASTLSTGDTLDKSSLISSGLAGGIAAGAISRDMSTLGESIRSVNVQNNMMELQDRMSSNSSYGSSYGNDYGYNNSYNSGYNSDYGATEFVRRRGYGSVEFNRGGRYGRIESGGMSSPEVKMAAQKLAGGALQGAKYGSIIGGAVSAVVNAYNVITGKEKGASAMGAVVADTVTSGLSGAGGAVSGGLATMGLGMIGIGGLPGIVVGVGVGAAGAVASQLLMQKSGLYDSIKEKVAGFFGGNQQ